MHLTFKILTIAQCARCSVFFSSSVSSLRRQDKKLRVKNGNRLHMAVFSDRAS